MSLLRRGFCRGYATRQVTDILDVALPFVPRLGWKDSVTEATRHLGLSDQVVSIFPQGAARALVEHNYSRELQSLKDVELKALDPTSRVKELLHSRLLANEKLGSQLGEATKIMACGLPGSLKPLNALSDEIWYLAGDRSTDTTWYTRRGSLAGIYAASESFMARDKSRRFRDTLALAEKLVDSWGNLEYAGDSTAQWLQFNAISTLNVLRSLSR